ncbi:unnamed protein product [Brassica oleracea]
MEKQATKEDIPVEKRVKSRKPYIPKHLRREVNKGELEGFHKRVKRVPKDMSFEDAYHKYRLGNFFRESRETDKDIELLFNKVSRKPKRTMKKEQDPGNIMAIDTADLLGLKMEPSKDSFSFVDSSRVNSAGMIKNVKVKKGECIIPVDFHAMDIKPGKTSPLLVGRAFMATVGGICDLKRNKMCLTNVDEAVSYDPMEKKKSEELISCIDMFEDPELISIASPQYQNQRRSPLELQHRSTSSPQNRSTIRLQHRMTLSLLNRSTRSLQHRSIPSDFQNCPRLKSLSLGEGTRIERRKRKEMQMQIPY